MNKRASGILMPVSSLPGPYGIGCFSKEARAFVDWLADAGADPVADPAAGSHQLWGQSLSVFFHLCGQPLFHRPRDAGPGGAAVCRGIAPPPTWAATPPTSTTANCTATAGPCCGRPLRHGVRRAAPGEGGVPAVSGKECVLAGGLCPLYGHQGPAGGAPHGTSGPTPCACAGRMPWPGPAANWGEEVAFQQFVQYEFDRQWSRLKEYANSKEIRIIGDIPIYVAFDSADYLGPA